MARNDDGEFELILGNRQLISVFLIVVILLGVFFSMGYIVGRNSGPGAVAENRSGASGKPIVVDSSSHAAAAVPDEAATSASTTPSAAPAPEQSTPAEEKPSPASARASAEKKMEEPKKAEESKPPATEPGKRAAVGEPPPGTYLQVVATSRADAEIVSESLLKKGFRSMVAPVPDSTLNRVVVGPVKDAGEMADVRARLEKAGFKPYVRKY